MKSTLVEHKMSVSIEFSIRLLAVDSFYAGEADSNSYCVLSRLKLVLCIAFKHGLLTPTTSNIREAEKQSKVYSSVIKMSFK